jgi:hypothetical protein
MSAERKHFSVSRSIEEAQASRSRKLRDEMEGLLVVCSWTISLEGNASEPPIEKSVMRLIFTTICLDKASYRAP